MKSEFSSHNRKTGRVRKQKKAHIDYPLSPQAHIRLLIFASICKIRSQSDTPIGRSIQDFLPDRKLFREPKDGLGRWHKARLNIDIVISSSDGGDIEAVAWSRAEGASVSRLREEMSRGRSGAGGEHLE